MKSVFKRAVVKYTFNVVVIAQLPRKHLKFI